MTRTDRFYNKPNRQFYIRYGACKCWGCRHRKILTEKERQGKQNKKLKKIKFDD